MENATTINEVIAKYNYWEKENKAWLTSHEKKCSKLLNEFKTKFPISSIGTIAIDQYVVGKKTNDSFCWWVENCLRDLGDIRGGQLTAFQRFGIYYDDEKHDYVFGGKKTKKTKFGETKDEVFHNVRNELVALMDAIVKKDYEGIISNKLNPLFKNKLTYLYDETMWIPIYGDGDLNILLSALRFLMTKIQIEFIRELNFLTFTKN
ncbi:MAG: hypothetical protein WCR63_04130 [Bacilli bacterium]